MILDFVDYFEDNFIGRQVRNQRRRAPRFAIALWNCFSRLDQQLPRTNNSNEGWHRAIQVLLISGVLSLNNTLFIFLEFSTTKPINI